MRKAPKGGAQPPIDKDINRIIAMVTARVEHPFRVLKRQFGNLKTRYWGLAKNRVQLFTLFALGNLRTSINAFFSVAISGSRVLRHVQVAVEAAAGISAALSGAGHPYMIPARPT